MPIHIPELLEPFNGTPKQWAAYFAQQEAGLEYIQAYRSTIGVFALFSRSKNRRLDEARKNYHAKRDEYWQSLR